MMLRSPRNSVRTAVAAVELAVCLPLILLLFAGLLEVSRIVDVQQVATNGSREAARDASLGQLTLAPVNSSGAFTPGNWLTSPSVAYNTLTYLQSADPLGKAFGLGHTTTIQVASPSLLPSGYTGYTVTDTTANQELFTIFFYDVTNTTVTDPTGAAELDHFKIGMQIPYRLVSISPIATVTGAIRLNTTLDWASMVDSPFQITPTLPAQ
jgi:Flp pilus assembly protein TadG